jgi:hypothetical protein
MRELGRGGAENRCSRVRYEMETRAMYGYVGSQYHSEVGQLIFLRCLLPIKVEDKPRLDCDINGAGGDTNHNDGCVANGDQ